MELTPNNTVIISQKKETIRAEMYNTPRNVMSGKLDEALDAETLDALAAHYYACRCSPHWSNKVFGAQFSVWEQHVKKALVRRGILFVAMPCRIFGPHILELA